MDRDQENLEELPKCSESGCVDDAAFFIYTAESKNWHAICDRHARHIHPSLEIHAWLESGYMRPVEIGKPEEPPSEPRDEREEAFRTEVRETMGWAE